MLPRNKSSERTNTAHNFPETILVDCIHSTSLAAVLRDGAHALCLKRVPLRAVRVILPDCGNSWSTGYALKLYCHGQVGAVTETASAAESWAEFYGLLSPLKRNVKLILSVANAFCGASAQQKFPLCFSKSGLDRVVNLCLSSAAQGWHFIAGEGEEEKVTCCTER